MQKVIILDFGSQVTQLIARRIRELEIYCEIIPYYKAIPEDEDIKAVILSGSHSSVRDPNHPSVDLSSLTNKYPVFAICYGAQLVANNLGGEVQASNRREYGRALLRFIQPDEIFKEVPDLSQVWMSHSDTISSVPNDFEVIADTESIPIAGFKSKASKYPLYGFQFHPEVMHTKYGKNILDNFLKNICQIKSEWTTTSFIEESVSSIQAQVKNEQVLLALSGGVDSSVAALIMKQAIGTNLHCFFIDNGLLRMYEYEQVLTTYKEMGLEVKGIDARKEFYAALKGVIDPEKKR